MPSPKVPSARTLENRGKRVVLNRAALDEIMLAVADGAFEFAKMVVLAADVPDAAPYGEGLIEGGGIIAYVDKRSVAVYPDTSVKKPRRAKLGPGIQVVAGFGFPGRFQEQGTINQSPHPFLTPELMADLPEAASMIQLACIRRKVVSASRAAKGDTYGAGKARAAG